MKVKYKNMKKFQELIEINKINEIKINNPKILMNNNTIIEKKYLILK